MSLSGRSVRVNDSTSEQPPSEDGEATSTTEALKNFFKKNKREIVVGGAALVAVIGVVMKLAEGQGVTKEAKALESHGQLPEPLVAEFPKRQSPARHAVTTHKRTLSDGRVVDVSGYERGVLAA